MPIYEYQCQKCEKVFEITQKITEAPKKKCPECSGKLEKLLSAPAFHLKGGGWYVTDFAGKKTDNKGEGKPETKPEVKTESKSETKSETKSEAKSEKPKPKTVDN